MIDQEIIKEIKNTAIYGGGGLGLAFGIIYLINTFILHVGMFK